MSPIRATPSSPAPASTSPRMAATPGRSWAWRRPSTSGASSCNPRDPRTPSTSPRLAPARKSSLDRGLYKTTDGGVDLEELINCSISDKAGFVDVALDPRDPNHLYAAAWERLRTPGTRSRAAAPDPGLWDVNGRRRDLDGNQGRRIPRGREGSYRTGDFAQRSELHLRRSRGGGADEGRQLRPRARSRGHRSLSLDRRRQDVDAHEHGGHASLLLLAGPRRSEEPRSRLFRRRTQIQVSDDGGKTARAPRRSSRCTSTTTASGSTRMIPSVLGHRERRRRLDHVRSRRKLHPGR